jgi:hypothetical protein
VVLQTLSHSPSSAPQHGDVNIAIELPSMVTSEVRAVQSGCIIRPGNVITLNTPLG